MQVLASHLGWLNIAGLCSFYFSFSILSTQVVHLQRCSFRIKASEAHQARRAPLRRSSSIPARCPLRLPVPELTGSVTGPCRKGYGIVSNEISVCSSLAPGHLLLLRRLFSSNGEAYYCIPLSKSHLGRKGEVQRDSGRWIREVLTSSQFPSCLISETGVLEIDLKQIKITELKDEKKEPNCCVSHSFLSSLDALQVGMHNPLYIYIGHQ